MSETANELPHRRTIESENGRKSREKKIVFERVRCKYTLTVQFIKINRIRNQYNIGNRTPMYRCRIAAWPYSAQMESNDLRTFACILYMWNVMSVMCIYVWAFAN